MIDNHQVRRLSGLSRLIERTYPGHHQPTTIQRTTLIFRTHSLPGIILDWTAQRDFAFVATIALQQPDQYFCQRSKFIQMSGASPPCCDQSAWAKVITASFKRRCLKGYAQSRLQKRDVLQQELVL